MLTETPCEICGENNWQILGQRTYTESQSESCSPYEQKRLAVLFHKWLPDEQSVTFKSTLCRNCGFIIFLPRPEEADVASAHEYLFSLAQDSVQDLHNSNVLVKRSNNMFRYLNKNINLKKVTRVLDYGGRDGSLMSAFVNAGKQCYLVDFYKNCIQNVTKLADTIDHLDKNEKFDLIICSHVMEHVAQPLKILTLLGSHLNEDGHIFIEVPMEVWKRAPLPYEPVTHINFFTSTSVYNLLLNSGLIVKKCAMVPCPHYISATMSRGIRAIGKKPDRLTNTLSDKPELNHNVMDMLKPDFLHILHYHICVPRQLPRVVLDCLKFFIRKYLLRK